MYSNKPWNTEVLAMRIEFMSFICATIHQVVSQRRTLIAQNVEVRGTQMSFFFVAVGA